MKRLRKNVIDKDYSCQEEKLKAYSLKTNKLLSSGRQNTSYSKILPSLLGLAPLVAGNMIPERANAQCDIGIFVPGSTILANVAGNGFDMSIDVDGDGTLDFRIDASTGTAGGGMLSFGDVFLGPLNGAEVLGYDVAGGYFYTTRFNASDAITSAAGIWKDAPALMNNIATLDYQNNGPWNGVGIVSGFLGIRIDGNKLGFIQVSWDNGVQLSVDAAVTGVQHPSLAGNNSVDAGVCTTLPVELVGLKVNLKEDSKLQLAWSTLTETNNRGFEIQRSTDGQDFRKIGWVEGQGNTYEKIAYTFEDESILPNTPYYYRLKQFNYNGNFNVSGVVSGVFEDNEAFQLTKVSPNPASDQIKMHWTGKLSGQSKITVFDGRGALLIDSNISDLESSNSHHLDISNLESGIYYIKVVNGSVIQYQRFVKQ